MILGQKIRSLFKKEDATEAIRIINTVRNLNFEQTQFNQSAIVGDSVNVSLSKQPVKTFFAVLNHPDILSTTIDVLFGTTGSPATPYICDKENYKNTPGSNKVLITQPGRYLIQARFELELHSTNPHTFYDANVVYQLYSNSAALYESTALSFTYPAISVTGHTTTYGTISNGTYRHGTITSIIDTIDDLDNGEFNIKAIPYNASSDTLSNIRAGSNITIQGPL